MTPAERYRYIRRRIADPMHDVMGDLTQFLLWDDQPLPRSDALVLEAAREVLQDVTAYLTKWLNMRAIEIEAEGHKRD
jgi:hypothetical protein